MGETAWDGGETCDWFLKYLGIGAFILKLFKVIAGLSGLALFALFGFVAAAAYSASEYQCPDGNDCHDAKLAMIVGGILAMMSLTLTIPLCQAVWRVVKGV